MIPPAFPIRGGRLSLLNMSTSDETQQWLDEAKSDLLSALQPYNKSTCIFSAPRGLLNEYEDAYVPRIVSIGPYHFGKQELREMEIFKGEAVRRELVRIQKKTGNFDFSFHQVIDMIFGKVAEILRCYDKDIPYNAEVVCWMMARDACFILEFFRSYIWQLEDADQLFENDEDFHFREPLHPIFGLISENHVVKSEIMRDLIKLENQIPLFVLEQVLAMEMGGSVENPKSKLQILLNAVFDKIYYRPFEYCAHVQSARQSHIDIQDCADEQSLRQNHILDMYYYCCLGDGKDEKYPEEKRKRFKCPSAVELKKGRVKIQATGTVIEDISFEGRTLSIPLIKLDGDSEIFIRNLIALEICSPYGPLKRMTAFVEFMNELCQTEKGAAVMRKNGVIVSNLGEDSEVVRFFSSCKQSRLVPSFYPIQITRANLIIHSTSSYWIIWDAYLKPWLVIGGIGATIVILLTAVQVFCLFISCGAR